MDPNNQITYGVRQRSLACQKETAEIIGNCTKVITAVKAMRLKDFNLFMRQLDIMESDVTEEILNKRIEMVYYGTKILNKIFKNAHIMGLKKPINKLVKALDNTDTVDEVAIYDVLMTLYPNLIIKKDKIKTLKM